MTETYVLPDTPDGLILAINTTLNLRRLGFKTRLVPTEFGHDVANTLVAVPPPRRTRREICPLNSRLGDIRCQHPEQKKTQP